MTEAERLRELAQMMLGMMDAIWLGLKDGHQPEEADVCPVCQHILCQHVRKLHARSIREIA